MNKITKFDPNKKIWLCSDTHFGHVNICRGTSTWENLESTRDFQTLEEMNQHILNNINNMVGADDILIHAGDFSFRGLENIRIFREQIICKNIYFILGNHDHHIENNNDGVRNLFTDVSESMLLERKLGGKTRQFFISHLPVYSWPNIGFGVFHLHGHTHLPAHLRLSDGRYMDIGIDGNDLKPILLEDVFELLRYNKIKNLTLPKDNHL